MTTHLVAKEINNPLQNGGINYTVVDCRPLKQFSCGHFPRAMHLDADLVSPEWHCNQDGFSLLLSYSTLLKTLLLLWNACVIVCDSRVLGEAAEKVGIIICASWAQAERVKTSICTWWLPSSSRNLYHTLALLVEGFSVSMPALVNVIMYIVFLIQRLGSCWEHRHHL